MKLEFLVTSVFLAQTAFGAVVHVPVERALRPAPNIQKRDVVNKPVFNVVVNVITYHFLALTLRDF